MKHPRHPTTCRHLVQLFLLELQRKHSGDEIGREILIFKNLVLRSTL